MYTIAIICSIMLLFSLALKTALHKVLQDPQDVANVLCQHRVTDALYVCREHDSGSTQRLKRVSFSLCNRCAMS